MIKEFVIKQLRELADKIEDNKCELTELESEELLKLISHEPMSKAQAFAFLHISRSQFDSLVKDGKIPEGVKRVGFKEKVWYKNELEKLQL